MILADSSIWIDHIRTPDKTLHDLLNAEQVWVHPFIVGELAMGSLPRCSELLHFLNELQQSVMAKDHEVLHLVEQQRLFGLGIGYIDAHLLVSTRLTPGARLWTRDKRLHQVALRLVIASHPPAIPANP